MRNNVQLDEGKAINPRNLDFKPIFDSKVSLSSYKDFRDEEEVPTSNEDNFVDDYKNRKLNC